jgi:membrane-anchored protein YejM (alkaline phosphatase superfamily)
MSKENAIDLFVRLGFGELYWANLRFSTRRQRYLLVAAGVIWAVIGSAVVYVRLQKTPDDAWVKFAEGIKPWS